MLRVMLQYSLPGKLINPAVEIPSAATIWPSLWLARKLQHSTAPVPRLYSTRRSESAWRVVCLSFAGLSLPRTHGAPCVLFETLLFRGIPSADSSSSSRCSILFVRLVLFALPEQSLACFRTSRSRRSGHKQKASDMALGRRYCHHACWLILLGGMGSRTRARTAHVRRPSGCDALCQKNRVFPAHMGTTLSHRYRARSCAEIHACKPLCALAFGSLSTGRVPRSQDRVGGCGVASSIAA